MGSKPTGLGSGFTRRAAMTVPVALGAAAYTSRWAWAIGPQKGGMLRATTYANPTSLDPATSRSGADFIVLNPMYDTLIEFEPESMQTTPGLAESWEWLNDTTLALNLRKGVVFHDGTPFDANAVKANFERILTDPRITIKADIAVVKSVESDGASRVVLRLSEADTTLPAVLTDKAGMMSSPKAFTAAGADYDRKPVGTGPMEFVEWADGDQVVMKRNPKYWRPELPYLDGITVKVIVDTNTGMRSVLAGQNDLSIRVDAHQLPALQQQKNFGISVVNTLRLLQCYINHSRPPFNDVRVRQAMNYAIDRVAFTRAVIGPQGEPGNVYLPKSHWAYDAEAAARYPYDPDKAKKLLAEAGFSGGLSLHANYPSDQLTVQRMEIIGSFFSKVGINITQKTVGTLANTNKEWREGVGDIRMAGWSGRPDPSMTYALMFLPEGFFNIGNAEHSKELTQVIRDSKTAKDIKERKAHLAKVLRLEREWAMSMPLAYEPEIAVFQPKVKNFAPDLSGRPNLQLVYFES